MTTRVDEIAEGIYRISTLEADALDGLGMTYNQFLVDAEDALLFSTGMAHQFPAVAEAVRRVLPLRRLRWISSGHASRPDEFGSLDQWLVAAARATAAHGMTACLTVLGRTATRPPEVLSDGQVLDLGGRRVRYLDVPFVTGPWESGLMLEETTGTLFTGDLLGQPGPVPPLTDDDIVGRATAFHDQMQWTPYSASVVEGLGRLADAAPAVVAPMHGAASSAGADALRACAAYFADRVVPRQAATLTGS